MSDRQFFPRSLNIPADLYARINNYRFQARVRTESEAIRRLLNLGLEAEANRLAGLVNDMEAEPTQTRQWSKP